MSFLKQHFAPMLKSIRNRGFKIQYLDDTLPELDVYYDRFFPYSESITFEAAKEWVFHETSRRKQQMRQNTMKYLSIYLNSVGIESFVPSFSIGRDSPKPPQLLTDEQLIRFFHAADSLKPNGRSPNREYIVPVMFRMILACGLRNSEVGRIEMENIDLENGTIRILHSKGDKDRLVYMDDSLVSLCRRFNQVYSEIVPDRAFFFQISSGRNYPTKYNVDDWFDVVLAKAKLGHDFPNKPTVHGLRHLFAVKSMKKCLAEGEDFDNWIKYLSKYMGHETTSETMDYLHMVELLLPEYMGEISSITEGMGAVYEEY